MSGIGKKIVVVGISASGKSLFSRKLAEIKHIPLISTDSLMWKSGWTYVGDTDVVRKLDEASSASEWIIEGYITKEARSFVFARADTILYLDYSPLVPSWRYIKRWFAHRRNPRPELLGSPERFRFSFLKLIWTKGEARSLKIFLSHVENQAKIITLTSPRMAKNFLQAV